MSDKDKKELSADWKEDFEAREAAQKAEREKENAETLAQLRALSPEEKKRLIRDMKGDPDMTSTIGIRAGKIPDSMIDPELADLIKEVREAAASTVEVADVKQQDIKRPGRRPTQFYKRPPKR